MVLPGAFISLERSFADIIATGWRTASGELVQAVQSAVDAGDYDTAHDLVDRLNLAGALDDFWPQLEDLAVAAFIFGEQNYSGNTHTTALSRGDIPLPPELAKAITQLSLSLSQPAMARLSHFAHTMLRAMETSTDPAVALFRKADGAEKTLIDREAQKVADMVANLTASRIASFGFLTDARIGGAATYQVTEVLDGLTCPVCRYMHGRTFDVAAEYERTLEALGTDDPKDLQSIAPWPDQSRAGLRRLNRLDEAEMQARGYGSPPYHPSCRGLLTRSGTVTGGIAVGGLMAALPVILRGRSDNDLSLDVIADPDLRGRVRDLLGPEGQQMVVASYIEGGPAEAEAVLSDLA